MPDVSDLPDLPDHSDPSDSADTAAASASSDHAPEEPPAAGHAPSEPQSSADEPSQPPEHEVEGAVPPGYDWPTHGGYLGCLVGTLAACPIVGFIAANIWALFRLSWLAFPLFALLIVVSLVAIIGAGRLGWGLGKRFYRYYSQPRPTWGESDAAIEEGAVPPAAAAATEEAVSEGATDEDVPDEGAMDDYRTEIATPPGDTHG